MTDAPLLHTDPAGMVRLAVFGRTAVSAYRQIDGVLAERLGRHHAAYFSRPEASAEGIDWFGPEGAVPVTALPHDRLASIEAESARIASDIEALAESLKAEGGAPALLGFLIDLALVTPAGSVSLYAKGDQPILVRWGHQIEGGEIPALLPPDVPLPDNVAVPRRRRSSRLRWLAPPALTILLVVLAAKACTPLPPVIVEMTEPSPPIADPIPDLEKRRRELRERLTELERSARETVARCLGGQPLKAPDGG